MKKIISVLLICAMFSTLCACDGASGKEDDKAAELNTAAETKPVSEQETEPETKPVSTPELEPEEKLLLGTWYSYEIVEDGEDSYVPFDLMQFTFYDDFTVETKASAQESSMFGTWEVFWINTSDIQEGAVAYKLTFDDVVSGNSLLVYFPDYEYYEGKLREVVVLDFSGSMIEGEVEDILVFVRAEKEEKEAENEVTAQTNAKAESTPTPSPKNTPTLTPSPKKTPFTNAYGTATTKCAHSGCSNYIASSGDTNCCTTHSRKCLECGKYIDEDATWCMDCIEKALTSSAKSKSASGGSKASGTSGSSSEGKYWCMGKNDTCQNKTNSAYDFYCSSCDPNNDNVEG